MAELRLILNNVKMYKKSRDKEYCHLQKYIFMTPKAPIKASTYLVNISIFSFTLNNNEIFTVKTWALKGLSLRSSYISQGAGAGRGFNELNQEVRHRQGGWGHSLDHPPCSDKSQNLAFLRKSFFFILGGPQKILLGLKNLTFGGVILLKLFDPSNGFGATDGKIALLWHNQPWKSPKPWLISKRLRGMTKKVYGVQKRSLTNHPPHPIKKIDFPKIPKFCDLSEHGG